MSKVSGTQRTTLLFSLYEKQSVVRVPSFWTALVHRRLSDAQHGLVFPEWLTRLGFS